jgi:hypothetical protein
MQIGAFDAGIQASCRQVKAVDMGVGKSAAVGAYFVARRDARRLLQRANEEEKHKCRTSGGRHLLLMPRAIGPSADQPFQEPIFG